jgi:hypothetical protein
MSRITLKLHDPTGAHEATALHAPRLDSLAGKTICEISNIQWEHQRIFPAVRAELQKRFPTARIIPYTDIVNTRAELDRDMEKIIHAVKEKGADAVIVGQAA